MVEVAVAEQYRDYHQPNLCTTVIHAAAQPLFTRVRHVATKICMTELLYCEINCIHGEFTKHKIELLVYTESL